MRIGFTGTREGMSPAQVSSVREILERASPESVSHGDCVGADEDFDRISEDLRIPRRIFPSNLKGTRAHCETEGRRSSRNLRPLFRGTVGS